MDAAPQSSDKTREMMFTMAQLQMSAASRRAQMQGNSDQFYTFLTQSNAKKRQEMVEAYCSGDLQKILNPDSNHDSNA